MRTFDGSRATMIAAAVLVTATAGCRKNGSEDQDQIGASSGEVMASLDDSLDGRATSARLLPAFPLPETLMGPLWRRALDQLSPSAYAASCWPSTLTACSSGVRTRQFDACTLGRATLDGMITFTFNRPALCAVVTTGDTVTRTAEFTLTGPYGGTLTVSSSEGGQTLTKTDAGFDFTVGGIERVLKGPGGRTLFDISTRTTAPLSITGSSRADLTIVSGALEVTHHLAGYTVTLQPANLAWSATCNCAVSGSLTGTIEGGRLSGKSATVTVTSCGHADVTVDGETESVTLDRCASL